MENKIFKSYAKKILRSEAFVSVIIVFVLALGIIGSSYALYMDVDTDTNYQLVEVGDLAISFENGDNSITLSNLTPTTDDLAITQSDNLFSFYIYNTGTYTTQYDIKLVTDTGNSVDTQYINYQICKDNKDNCKDIKTLSNVTDSTIFNDELSAKKSSETSNPSSYYFLRLWINDQYPTSLSTSNQTVKLKVVIEATNASGNYDNTNTLVGKLLNNENITINNAVPNVLSAPTSEEGIYKTEDDYGISYYFRGAQSNNYVNFSGMCWRIVRIDGTGNIRLILASQKGECQADGALTDTSAFIADSDGNPIATDENSIFRIGNIINAFINGGSATAYEYWDNETSSIVYEEKTITFEALSEVDKIISTAQCEEGESVDMPSDFEGYAYNEYEAGIRIQNGTVKLTCDETGSAIKGNLLTPDEAYFAGRGSASYLNQNAKDTWWLKYMYSGGDDVSYQNKWCVYSNGNTGYDSTVTSYSWTPVYARPVIVISSDTKYIDGTGTQTDPFEIN